MLYHYTDLNGFLGIMCPEKEGPSLWVTDYRFMNDASEGLILKDTLDNVIPKLSEYIDLAPSDYEELSKIEFKDKHLYTGRRFFEKEKKLGIVLDDETFIGCFCQSSDSLDMWRAYSKNGTGCAIGFDGDSLRHSLTIDNPLSETEKRLGLSEFADVLYGDEEKEKRIIDIIVAQIKEYKEMDLSVYGKLGEYVAMFLENLKFQFKHSCFKSEEETRLIISIPKDKSVFQDKKAYEIYYRNSNGILAPYIDVPIPRETVVEIVVSPTASETAYEAVCNFVKKNYPEVNVKRSKLPLRF